MAKRKDEELAQRLLGFAVRIIELCNLLPNTAAGDHIRFQLLKSGTSPGANYEEARGAESKADFVHKLGIALKELKESRFWLRLIDKAFSNVKNVKLLLNECEELIAIIAKSIFTAKNRQKLNVKC